MPCGNEAGTDEPSVGREKHNMVKPNMLLVANIVPSSKALVTSSDALVSTSILLQVASCS